MMTQHRRSIGLMLLGGIVVALAGGCASPRDIRKELEPSLLNPGGVHRIYVATEESDWKRAVISGLATRLGPEYSITIDNLRTLSSVQTDSWDVVIVLSSFYAFGLQTDTATYLNTLDAPDRVILVVTSNISDPDEYDVDTISAASVGSTPQSARALTPARPPGVVAAEIAALVIAKVQ